MSEQRPYPSQEKQSGQTRWFSFLYRTRVMVHQGDIPIINLSLAFALLVAVSAPWVAVAGLAVALALGHRIHVERNAPGFSGDFQQVVHDAAEHVNRQTHTPTVHRYPEPLQCSSPHPCSFLLLVP